jgi:Spy/CpxP family protein refolding chaperone
MRPNLRTLALALATVALPLAAQGPRHGNRPAGPGPLFACLNLTDAQKASLKALHEKYRPALDAARTSVQEAGKGFRTAMANPSTSDADLKVLYDKASSARFAMLEQRRALLKDSLALLTPDQRAQWDKLKEERMHRGWNRRPGSGMGPGSGPGDPGPR